MSIEWIANGFGIMALIVNFIGYQQNDAQRYRLVAAIALGCLGLHFYLLGQLAGAIVLAIAVVRNIVALRYQGQLVLGLFISVNLAFWAWEWFWLQNHWAELFAAYVSSLIFTVGSIRLNDANQIRRWFIAAEGLGLVYACLVVSIPGALFNIVNLTSIISKLWREKSRLQQADSAPKS